jgi:excisionase family DNA binding protein
MQGKNTDAAHPAAKSEPNLYRVKDVAQKLSLTYRTLHRAIKNGRVHAIRCGGAVLIPATELQRIISKGF